MRGKKFVFLLDNIDWDVKAHDMQSRHQKKRVHAVATSIVLIASVSLVFPMMMGLQNNFQIVIERM